ncbi:MAG: hypothetical protein MJ156_01410 [Alphaproteobacteria bacterium]|nr:hypothetical protein [Alphaproteobacteria bacterium]
MLGISWTEFVVIILISICMIPVKYWPDVFRFFGKCVKWVRNMIWKISDVSEQVKERLDLEKPINDLIANATEDILKKQSKKILKTTRIKK